MSLIALLAAVFVFILGGCIGPPSLHEAVLAYDITLSRLERQMLLLNIARIHSNLPTHFTTTSSIAATFDYRTNTGFTWSVAESHGFNLYTFNLGASAAEKPTFSIVPIQGEEFTRRILTPMDEGKFEFLVFQGAPIDMVVRLLADGIEVQTRDGKFERFILNSPIRLEEYEEFRRRATHLAWLNSNRKLFVGTLLFQEKIRTKLESPLSARDLTNAAEKGYRWNKTVDGSYELIRPVVGRVAVTNYDLRTLSDEERQTLNSLAAANPNNFVFVDVRPGHPGGDFPLFGAIKLRSLNVILRFVAAGIDRIPEYDVKKDPRTGEVDGNPRGALTIEVMETPPPEGIPQVLYEGEYYSVADTLWDRETFTLLYQLYQMTVTDVSKVGVPITISK